MKLWHQSMADLNRLSTYGDAIRRHAAQVCDEGTEVVVHGLPPKDFVSGIEAIEAGTAADGQISTSDVLGSPYLYHIAYSQVIERAREAERSGYDAFMIGSFSEPFLREIRATVRIPVASVGESNFLLACSFGKFQAHIANVPTVARLVSDHVHEYRLESRVSGVYALGSEMDELLMQSLWKSPERIVARFTDIARRAIEAGADVIIPAEGVLSELLYEQGVRRVGNAPVFDSFGMLWKYTELLVRLHSKMGVSVGREWEYRHPDESAVRAARRSLGYKD